MTNFKLDSEVLYIRIGRLIENMPDIANINLTKEVHKWLGDANALVEASGDLFAKVELQTAIHNLVQYDGNEIMSDFYQGAINQITSILYRVLASAELKAPISHQGNFIHAGNPFDAMSAVVKIFNTAKNDILIIDPYLDEKILTDFAIAASENINIRLLADQSDHKASLKPAFQRWTDQHGNKRPLELKLAVARSLHDRLIITDNSEVWVLTQSFNALAARSHASIVRFPDPDIKIAAYKQIWKNASTV